MIFQLENILMTHLLISLLYGVVFKGTSAQISQEDYPNISQYMHTLSKFPLKLCFYPYFLIIVHGFILQLLTLNPASLVRFALLGPRNDLSSLPILRELNANLLTFSFGVAMWMCHPAS